MQTIYLGLAGLGLIGSLVFPLWTYELNSSSIEVSVWTAFDTSQTLIAMYALGGLGIWLMLGLGIVAWAALLYGNRSKQLMICRIALMLVSIAVGGVIYLANASDILWAGAIGGPLQGGTYALIAALTCCLLAQRSIRRDMALVESAERFR